MAAPAPQPAVEDLGVCVEDDGEVGTVDTVVELPHGVAGQPVESLEHQRGRDVAVADDYLALPQRGFDLDLKLVVAVGGAQARQRHAPIGVGAVTGKFAERGTRGLTGAVYGQFGRAEGVGDEPPC